MTEDKRVDWRKPIEAVHENGRVESVHLTKGPNGKGECYTSPNLSYLPSVWLENGKPWAGGNGRLAGWTIRNVQPKPAHRDPCGLCGVVACNGDCRSDLPAEVVERMVALVRAATVNGVSQSSIATEARAIVAMLPAPVDPDLLEARKILETEPRIAPDSIRWVADDAAIVEPLLVAAIRRGRDLARQDDARRVG